MTIKIADMKPKFMLLKGCKSHLVTGTLSENTKGDGTPKRDFLS